MSAETSEATAGEDFTRSWRYKIGLFMIIVGNDWCQRFRWHLDTHMLER